MAIPFLKRGSNLDEQVRQLSLSSYVPVLTLEGLAAGVDNVRHDVYLSHKFCDQARVHISRLITKYGNVEDLAVETSNALRAASPQPSLPRPAKASVAKPADTTDFKRLLTELQSASIQRAKAAGNISVDLLARLAIIKFLRAELSNQFGQVLERCRARLKQFDNPRNTNPSLGIELRDRFLKLQVRKKIILRLAGQDLFLTMRAVEKETLSRLQRSLFGGSEIGSYDLFINRLVLSEDGRDEFLSAEHYVMLGNFDRDPDRFLTILEAATEFLVAMNIPMEGPTDQVVNGWLNDPENSAKLVGNGIPESEIQKALLTAWMNTLERDGVMDYVIAAYEVVPLLSEYSPLINPQQLKNCLISKSERGRVEQLLREHSRMSPDKINDARKRVANCRGNERQKIAGRFLHDFMRYHRDLRRLEALNSALDTISVIGNEKLRELSTINNTLYEFLLPEEQKPAEEKILHHVILKADIRDSTAVTQTLVERGLNPASHFGLNFFEPVNKLLANYGASKVFVEGDAAILCIFGREGESGNSVALACALGRAILEVVRGYNQKLETDGLPMLELGIGICFQDGAPLYLVDGTSKIMISQALNDSDRLSSCSRITRKLLTAPGMFNVYAFETDEGGQNQAMQLRYNIGGIHLSQSAFEKLRHELSLEERHLELPTLWDHELVTFYAGLVPLASGAFHKIILREGQVARVDARTLEFKSWSRARYYEVCTSPTVYEFFEAPKTENAAAHR
jgi:hypothetical protein